MSLLNHPLQSIRVRIIAAMMTAVIALLGAMFFLVVQLQGVSNSMAYIIDGYLPLKEVVGQLERDHQRVGTDMERLLRKEARPGLGATSTTVIYSDSLRVHLDEARSLALATRDASDSSAEKAALLKVATQLNHIEELFKSYELTASQVNESLATMAPPVSSAQLEGMRKINAELGTEIDNLERLIDNRIQQLNEATASARVRATAISATLAGLGFLLALGLVAAILYALRPIGRLTAQIQRLTKGDYTGRVEVKGSDEIALLASAFNQMVQAVQLRDETLVERAEELNRLSGYLASVLDSLEDSLLVIENGKVTLSNPAAKEQWEATLGAAVPPALKPLLDQPGHHELGDSYTCLHEIRVIPFGEHGQVIVTADVTQQTQDKEKLARSERLALIGQMLAQITHEVRNPLNALSLNVELLADELAQLDPGRKTESWDLFETVSREIDRLTAVTGHYLQLARRPPAQFASHNLNQVLDEIHHLLLAELEQQNVRLKVTQHPVAPIFVDGNQLRQAILNLVRNATEAGARQLELKLTENPSQVEISLSDDAEGMTDEQLDRAFDPFYSTKATGTGLGLAITRQILEDHGGSITVNSELGQGTTVTLIIPKRQSKEAHEISHAAEYPGR
jgi:nitrogen fixation/metabolism regulation signal transduction histidine kinase